VFKVVTEPSSRKEICTSFVSRDGSSAVECILLLSGYDVLTAYAISHSVLWTIDTMPWTYLVPCVYDLLKCNDLEVKLAR
jgi:hypothetical protein